VIVFSELKIGDASADAGIHIKRKIKPADIF
jgi:hypothetical protein